MFIPTWFFYVCYGFGAILFISAVFTMVTGNTVLMGKLRHSVTNQKKAATALSIYLVVSAIIVSSIPLFAARIGRGAGFIFIAYLLFSGIFWYIFQSKWVGPISKQQPRR
ncbi:hypothetical protein SAMN05877753_101333 [Bacillus oleivorans]|uniref:Uncharacterized protein n=1 Tax=Bacillus oleivorans TaxID=1448271 RepID=A0A285CHN6_9BACI|nr:hypothetical protein [Bacillus oleivorans]SNX67019.1 hypothetical protein SAMN05877753_101333 [Bacillus oleivorans]